MSQPNIAERQEIHESSGNLGGWIVTVYDNDHNTTDEVLHILMLATQCDAEEAAIETWEVHNLGKSVVHHGQQNECEEAAGVIAQIGIRVEVTEE